MGATVGMQWSMPGGNPSPLSSHHQRAGIAGLIPPAPPQKTSCLWRKLQFWMQIGGPCLPVPFPCCWQISALNQLKAMPIGIRQLQRPLPPYEWGLIAKIHNALADESPS